MVKISQIIFPFFLAILATISCVDSYEPEVISQSNSFLVVEGFLSSGNDSSIIQLSRTVNLSEFAGSIPESGAKVAIESESGATSLLLTEVEEGDYVLEPVELNADDRYRLKINTVNGQEYLSEYVEVKITPPIDSISWVYETEGVTIYVNTHDPENQSLYYRWEYEEDWEYLPPYISELEYDPATKEMKVRPEPTPSHCYVHNKSTHIILGSSAKLSEDIISEQFLTFIPRDSQRLSFKYSILVRQYVLSKEVFEYYQQMKKNSEEMGSLFDPQPMELEGNIHSTNSPDEPVIGFFSIGSLQEERIFMHYYDVSTPQWGFEWNCRYPEPDTLGIVDWYDEFTKGLLVPLDSVPCFGPNPVCPLSSVLVTTAFCVDCIGNSSGVKPSFWDEELEGE